MGKANATLGMIKRNITCKSKNIVTKLYKALVRPKLEYYVQAWRPYLQKDIEKMERVQRRATKMIDECKSFVVNLWFCGLWVKVWIKLGLRLGRVDQYYSVV